VLPTGSAAAAHYQPGQCWNWFIGYRDPIANDPQVAAGNPVASLLSGIDPNLLWKVIHKAIRHHPKYNR
jgi:hypothetical protein